MSATETQAGPDEDYREHVTIEEIPAAGQKLLVDYSGLSTDALLPHILQIRDRAFKISPYPCVGQVRFLSNRWPSMPYFEDRFLPRLRSGATLLDVGCGFGQEIRFLAFEHGVDSSQLYGCDIEGALIDIGYDLFRDRRRLKATFFTVDLLDPAKSSAFNQLRGSLDLIQVSQLFHLWDWNDMVDAAKHVVALSHGPNSMIAGNQVGSRDAGSYAVLKSCAPTGRHFRHSEESWKHFWEQVGKETDTQWRVVYKAFYSQAVENSRNAWWAKDDPGMTMFWYSVTRI